MVIDTREKRASIPGVGRPWMRGKLPSSDRDQEWRQASGNAYAGIAVAEAVTPINGAGYYQPLENQAVGSVISFYVSGAGGGDDINFYDPSNNGDAGASSGFYNPLTGSADEAASFYGSASNGTAGSSGGFYNQE